MPITVAEQDDALDRIFAMVETGKRIDPAAPRRTRKRRARKKLDHINVMMGRFDVLRLQALFHCDELYARHKSVADIARCAASTATDVFADDPREERAWARDLKRLVRKVKPKSRLVIHFMPDELVKIDRLAKMMRTTRGHAIRAAIFNLYNVYLDDGLVEEIWP